MYLCLTTSRSIWLAVSIAFACAIRLLRENLWNISTPLSSGSSGRTCRGEFPKKTSPRTFS